MRIVSFMPNQEINHGAYLHMEKALFVFSCEMMEGAEERIAFTVILSKRLQRFHKTRPLRGENRAEKLRWPVFEQFARILFVIWNKYFFNKVRNKMLEPRVMHF